ncbi:hypothetical protein WL32_08270 [Burkholderia cepacia]|nr:hypothetical protein WL32_08270 [Burkholderia cepacia]
MGKRRRVFDAKEIETAVEVDRHGMSDARRCSSHCSCWRPARFGFDDDLRQYVCQGIVCRSQRAYQSHELDSNSLGITGCSVSCYLD